MNPTCVPKHDWFVSLLTFGLCCGLVISYLPQHLRIVSKRSSVGISPWFLLLGCTSSAAGMINMITLQWGIIRCCRFFTLSDCIEVTAGVIQVGLQWLMFNVILVLYMLYYPHELKFDQPNVLVHGKSSSRTPEWRRSIFVSIVVGLHLIFSLVVTAVILARIPAETPDDSPLNLAQSWATFLGVSSALLAAVQYAPQLWHTYTSKLVGALSIPMMCIQSPGAILMIVSIALRDGTNWTSWITFAVAGTMQCSLLVMCIAWKFRQHRLGVDDFGHPLPGAVDSGPFTANRDERGHGNSTETTPLL